MSSTDDVSSELFKKSYLLPILTIIISLLLGAAEAGGGGSGEETPWPLWELLIVFGIPIITCLIAKARGRGPVRWFFISLLLPVLGLIILLCMSNLKLGRRVMSSPTPLKCDLGKGEPQDDAQAAEWYREAAKDGNAKAQHNLGIMYHEGQGVKRDYAKAVELWTQASGHGLVEAQYNLAHMYANGQGVAQDYAQAAAWYRKAAKQGRAEAQYNLGQMYRRGEGVAQDYAQAHMWYNLAAAQGVENGAKWRDKVADKMTPDQVAEAQRLAREWMKKHSK